MILQCKELEFRGKKIQKNIIAKKEEHREGDPGTIVHVIGTDRFAIHGTDPNFRHPAVFTGNEDLIYLRDAIGLICLQRGI